MPEPESSDKENIPYSRNIQIHSTMATTLKPKLKSTKMKSKLYRKNMTSKCESSKLKSKAFKGVVASRATVHNKNKHKQVSAQKYIKAIQKVRSISSDIVKAKNGCSDHQPKLKNSENLKYKQCIDISKSHNKSISELLKGGDRSKVNSPGRLSDVDLKQHHKQQVKTGRHKTPECKVRVIDSKKRFKVKQTPNSKGKNKTNTTPTKKIVQAVSKVIAKVKIQSFKCIQEYAQNVLNSS